MGKQRAKYPNLPGMITVCRFAVCSYRSLTKRGYLAVQNIMAFLSNQNKVFQDTVDYLHKIHTELPAARVRNYDIPTAVDILTSGTYLRMPSKMKVS